MGFFFWEKRSKANLISLLRNYFNDVNVTIKKFIPLKIKITEVSRLGKNLFLNKNSFFGEKIQKNDRAILINIGPITWNKVEHFFLNDSQKKTIYTLLNCFLPKRMRAFIQLKFSLEKSHRAIFGSQNILLNWHAVLGSVTYDYYKINIYQ